MKVQIKQVRDNREDFDKVLDMMENAKGIREIFHGKRDRLLSSFCTVLVYADGEVVGFINLVDEHIDPRFCFVDMGILEKYRDRGIGKKALNKLMNALPDDFFIGEVKKDNVASNQLSENLGVRISSTEDRNFYLLRREDFDEFMDYDGMEKLNKKIDKEKPRQKKIKRNSKSVV